MSRSRRPRSRLAAALPLLLLLALLPVVALPGPPVGATTPIPPRCADTPPTGPGNGNSTVFDNAPGWHRQTAWQTKIGQAACAWQGGWYTSMWPPAGQSGSLTSTFVPDAVTLAGDRTSFSTIAAPAYAGSSSLVLVGRMTLTFTPGASKNACPAPSYCGPSVPMVAGRGSGDAGQWPGQPSVQSSATQAVSVNRDTNAGSNGCQGYPTPTTCTYFVVADKTRVDDAGGTVTAYVPIPWSWVPTDTTQDADYGNVMAVAFQVTGTPLTPSIVVNSTGDQPLSTNSPTCSIAGSPDICTLRAAIQLVNSQTTPQTVSFAIPGAGAPRLTPATPLPKVTTPVTLDGSTQPGGRVELSGAVAGASADGIEVDGPASVVRGFVVNGFAGGAGIVAGGADQKIVGNRVGTDVAGTAAVPNLRGIVYHGPRVTIGGPTGATATACAGDCNLVSGNTDFQIGNTEVATPAYAAVTVQGNWVGVDSTGTARISAPATARGISAGFDKDTVFGAGDAITIGGTASRPGVAPGNLVATASFAVGVAPTVGRDHYPLSGTVRIAGNLVGEDVAGSGALGHGSYGLYLIGGNLGAGAAVVGGDAVGDRNVVGGQGVGIFAAGGRAVSIVGNRAGTNLGGTAAVPNDTGIQGEGVGEIRDNLASGNTRFGVAATSAVLTRGNIIGLDVTGTKALPNDVGIGVDDRRTETAYVGTDPTSATAVCTVSPCNVVSGNTTAGIQLDGADVDTLQLAGTYVGTDVTGTRALPNGVGIDITSPNLSQQRIGGASNAAAGKGCQYPCNVIAGNTRGGILLTSKAAAGGDEPGGDRRVVSGNYLGVDADGAALPNGGPQLAVAVAGAETPAVVVGGDLRRGNFLSSRAAPGSTPAVVIDGSSSSYPFVTLASNAFHVPAPGTAIRRPVLTVNPPLLATARVDGTSVVVTGSTRVAADPLESPEQIELYAVSTCGAAGTYRPIATGSAGKLGGDFSVEVPAAALAGRSGIYALRTDQAGSTSAFSACLTGPTITTATRVLKPGALELEVASTAGWTAGAYAQVDVAGHPIVRRVAKLGSLVFAAPLARRVPVGTPVVRVTAPKHDTAGPQVTVRPQPLVVARRQKLVARFTCTDGKGVGVEKCPPATRLPSGVLGVHHLVVVAYDRNGNVTRVRVSWRVVR